MITHYYLATYTVRSVGRRWLKCALARGPGRREIIDKVLRNEVSAGWQPGETHTIAALHHDTPSPYGHRVTITPLACRPAHCAGCERGAAFVLAGAREPRCHLGGSCDLPGLPP